MELDRRGLTGERMELGRWTGRLGGGQKKIEDGKEMNKKSKKKENESITLNIKTGTGLNK